MKTRIISGIIMGAIVAVFLVLTILVNPLFITALISFATAVSVYELLHNAVGIKSKTALIGAMVYGALAPFLNSFNLKWFICLSIAYFLFTVVVTLKEHKDFALADILSLCAMPIVLSFAFCCLEVIINADSKLYYLVLLFNFASICDMGAYFVGVTLGKHKLCPAISPKKTIEGAIGGIISSIIFTVIFVFLFGHSDKLIFTVILTVPLCIVGMLGDLFASAIKRSVNLKDYGKLIPGHGGILDRVDSLLLIAPVLYLFISFGVI